MTARRFRVAGVVQGVGFRAWTRRAALRHSISGYAKNLPDGTVEVLAIGPEPALDLLEALVRQGPPWGRVDQVEVENLDESEPHKGFDIR